VKLCEELHEPRGQRGVERGEITLKDEVASTELLVRLDCEMDHARKMIHTVMRAATHGTNDRVVLTLTIA
jgi:hypothetical protein